MKKTLLVTIDYSPNVGGVSTYLGRLATDLGSDFVVLTSVIAPVDKSGQVLRKRLLYKFFWPRWVKGIFVIFQAIKKTKCQQILVGQVLPVGSMVYFLNKFMKIPYFVQLYGMDLLQAKSSKRKTKLVKAILKNSQHIFVNSNVVGKLAEKFGVVPKDYTVIYPVPEITKEVSKNEVDQLKKEHHLSNQKIIFSLGRLVSRKGQDKTLGAMLHVWQEFPEAVYVIAGDGPDKKRLQKMAEPHKDKVIFLGQISDQQKNVWLEACDVFVMPARQASDDIEGFGIVYLEAAAHKKPVIAGNSGGAVEAVDNERSGLLVDSEEVDEIAKSLLRLLADEEYARQLGENSYQRLKQEFGWPDIIGRLKKRLS